MAGEAFGFILSHLGVCLAVMAVTGHRPRKDFRTKADIERERRELWERTCREVDEIVARYHARFPRHLAKWIGAVYARYSTRHQDSIPDQVRKILEEAIRLEIYVPREYVFFDLAVRGHKKHRQGLDQLRAVLKAKKVGALLLFATNRLFRKVYRTLEFVDQVHKGWGIRCVFVKSGVDTDDTHQWEMILHAQSMIDQFVVTMYVENIRAAHEGLLEKRLVFGTVSFGYYGEPIDGLFTVHGRPRCRIVIYEETARIVRLIFTWYVEDGVSINEIIRRLNDDPDILLPPRCQSGMWTRTAVLRALKNTRYRGVWRYGVAESVYVPEGDYVRERMRVEPLKEVRIEELRIIDDQLWYAAQKRLAQEVRRRGRKPKDGDRRSRPRLLNGLYYCPEHHQILYVGGPNGRSMRCPRCQGTKAEKRPLFSLLNRRLALKLTCEKLAELLHKDEELTEEVVEACRQEAEVQQQPDPTRLNQLRAKEQKLRRAIEFNQRNPGETEADQSATVKLLRELPYEDNEVLREIAALEKARDRKINLPSRQEVGEMIQEFSRILADAATGKVDEDAETAREIIELMTGGRIDLYQMGERAAQRGWLQGRFTVRLLSALAEHVTGVPVEAEDGIEVVIDYRHPVAYEAEAERAKVLYDQGLMNKQIAQELGCCPAKVTNLLDYAFEKRGGKRPDGRKRRATLKKKQMTTAKYQESADEAKRLWEKGLSAVEIGRRIGCSDTTAWKAIAHWHRVRGLPIPNAKTRRERIMNRAKQLYDAGWEIKEIAAELGYTSRGMKLLLERWFEAHGQEMPDGRSRRHNRRKAS